MGYIARKYKIWITILLHMCINSTIVLGNELIVAIICIISFVIIVLSVIKKKKKRNR